jgi:hypothetical protein
MMNMAPEEAWSDTAPMARSVRRRSMGFFHISTHPTPELISFSFSMAALISAASAAVSSPSGLSQSSDFFPSSYLPCKINHRGDSGMNLARAPHQLMICTAVRTTHQHANGEKRGNNVDEPKRNEV